MIARWAIGCSLIAMIAGSLSPLPADAMAPKAPEASKQRTSVITPAKRATRQIHARVARPLLCRDSCKLRMGVASWYAGSAFHRTASGETFRADEMTAASRSLPFNTRIRVTNLRNGRSVVVRINDRGPYVRGRILDLTPKAAAELGMKLHGTAPVYFEIVRRETQSAAADPAEFDQH